MQVDTIQKHEETMHVHGRDLFQDSTFDLFKFFLLKFLFQNLSC